MPGAEQIKHGHLPRGEWLLLHAPGCHGHCWSQAWPGVSLHAGLSCGQQCVPAPSAAGSELLPCVQLNPGPLFRPQLWAMGTLQVKLAMGGHNSVWFWTQKQEERGHFGTDELKLREMENSSLQALVCGP